MSDNDHHHNIENEAEAESAQVQFLELLKWEEESVSATCTIVKLNELFSTFYKDCMFFLQ